MQQNPSKMVGDTLDPRWFANPVYKEVKNQIVVHSALPVYK